MAIDLAKLAEKLSWKSFRIRQVLRAREIELAEQWSDITTLPKADRDWLAKNAPFDSLTIKQAQTSADKTAIKFLLSTTDDAEFETVLLLHSGEQKSWGTVCVSSQIGCPLGCTFCATGQMRFGRNLTTVEILDQFLIAKRVAKKHGIASLNVVFMGMGEPLLNLPAVISAIRTLTDPARYGLSPARITVSTSGILPGLQELRTAKLNIGLALSLHAPENNLRSSLMPINQTYPLKTIMTELKNWERAGTEVLYEYVLIAGVNDQPDTAERLIKLLRGRHAKLNLIPLNPVSGSPLKRPDKTRLNTFLATVRKAGLQATLRHTKGDDIAAACGQLKATNLKKKAVIF